VLKKHVVASEGRPRAIKPQKIGEGFRGDKEGAEKVRFA
jgi:hypothetical protein